MPDIANRTMPARSHAGLVAFIVGLLGAVVVWLRCEPARAETPREVQAPASHSSVSLGPGD